MQRHLNISIFVPHSGCTHMCSFCNQRYITGQSYVPHKSDVDKAVDIALSSERYDAKCAQICFFGGSFTAISQDYMLELLNAAKERIDKGDAESIRISTRPDCIDDKILYLLKEYGVKSIELGAQSMCDDVLKLNERGHTSSDVERSSKLIRQFGFELGLQMMTGLYGDTDEKALVTAQKIIDLRPDTVRIYPTVVLDNTRLCELYKSGDYRPQTAEQACALGAELIKMFEAENIKIIRFGLHSIDEEHFVAGPWHPSLAEMAYSQIFLEKAEAMLKNMPKGDYIIYCGERERSKMSGNGKSNLEKLRKLGYNCRIMTDSRLSGYDIKISVDK